MGCKITGYGKFMTEWPENSFGGRITPLEWAGKSKLLKRFFANCDDVGVYCDSDNEDSFIIYNFYYETSPEDYHPLFQIYTNEHLFPYGKENTVVEDRQSDCLLFKSPEEGVWEVYVIADNNHRSSEMFDLLAIGAFDRQIARLKDESQQRREGIQLETGFNGNGREEMK